MNLKNKTVLITGASSGIGYSIAKLLPKENCSLALLSRRIDKLQDLVDEIENYGGIAKAYRCNVANTEEVKKVFADVKTDFDKIDIALLNSGISSRAEINNYSSKTAKEIFDVNTLGIVNCVEQLLPDFIKRKDGMIVGVSSLAESRGYPKSGFYNASKAAATLLLESLRVELKPFNVKVLIIKPGFVKTAMTDKNEFYMPFMIDADKAARIIIEGIKKGKKVIQFPLPIVIGSKLARLLPDWLFDFLMSKPLPPRKN